MAENKLPSGVGKKIVQALKKQAEVEIQPVSDSVTIGQSDIRNAVEQSTPKVDNDFVENNNFSDDFGEFSIDEQNEDFSDTQDNSFDNSFENTFSSDFNESFDNISFEETEQTMFEEKEIFKTPTQNLSNVTTPNYAVPANVAVLKRLILQLPQGVSKQTGAQIIRQTMEALGISMNSVLKEAQQGQDSITASAKACLATIAEYKNSIRGLEKQVQDYKKQAIALNELISLFVMTEK